MVGRCTEGREEVEKLSLLSLADALEIKNLAEVGVGFVGNMDKVGLHEGFWRRRTNLQRFEKRVDLGHGLIYAFDEALP